MTYQSEVLTDAPLAFWRLGDASGSTTLLDSSGNARHASTVGTPVLGTAGLVADDADTAMSVSESVTGAGSILSATWMNTATWSVEATVKFTSAVDGTNGDAVASRYTSAGYGWLLWRDTSGRAAVQIWIGGSSYNAFASTAMVIGTTYHLAATHDGTTLRLYVNGTLTASTAASGVINTGSPIEIGRYSQSNGTTPTAVIDEVSVYGTVLTQARISAHYSVLAGGASAYRTAVLADAPAGYFRLEETTGATTADSSGNARNGDWYGAPVRGVAGPVGIGGNGFNLGAGAAFSADAAWNSFTGPFTLECWHKPNGADAFLIEKYDTGAVNGYALRVEGGKLTVYTLSASLSSLVAPAAASNGAWHHYAFTHDGTSGRLYIDGALVAGPTAMVLPTDGTNSLKYGGRGDDAVYNIGAGGSLDEVALYPTALSSGRIAAHYAAGTGVAPTPTTTAALPITVGLPSSASTVAGIPATTSSLPISAGLPATGRTLLTGAGTLPISVALPSVAAQPGLPTTSSLPVTVGLSATAQRIVPIALDVTGSASMSIALSAPGVRVTLDLYGSSSTGFGIVGDAVGFYLDMVAEADTDMVLPRQRVVNPATGLAPYRLVVVDMQGTRMAELDKAEISPVADDLNGMGGFDFTMPADDPKAAFCLVPQREVQVWRGADLLGWFVLVRARGDDKTVTFSALGLEWYFTRRVMGKSPIPNLLKNGSFEEGERYWNFGYVAGSIPAKAPVHGISEDTLNGGKSLRISGASGTQDSSSTLQGDVNFAFDSAALTSTGISTINSLMAGIVADDPDIICEGHADSTGSSQYNYTLSYNRAYSVRNQILSQKPNASVTVRGYGETRPVATNATPEGRAANRRVEIRYSSLLEAKGHRQYAGQSFTITQPSSAKKAKTLTLVGWTKITRYINPAKDGYGVYMQMVDTSTGKVIRTTNVPIDQYTPRNRWTRMECSFDVPANNKTYRIDVRLYPPEGTCLWDEIGVTGSEQLAFFDTDEALIVKGLVAHAQDPAMGKSDLNIDFSGPLTKVTRTREYPWIERKTIDEAIMEFPTLADGMDVAFTFTPTTRTLTTYHPRKGKNRNYVLALGSNIATWSMDYDGQQTATRVIVQAEGEGSDREEGVYTDTSKMGGVVLETVYNATPGSSISSLQKQAERGVARYSRPVVIPQVVMQAKFTDEILDRVTKGDVVTVVIQKGWVDINALYRVTNLTVDPKTDQVSFSLTAEDVTF